eukprot:16442789-Heterocapsa_arctica.AAC.1
MVSTGGPADTARLVRRVNPPSRRPARGLQPPGRPAIWTGKAARPASPSRRCQRASDREDLAHPLHPWGREAAL